MVARVRVKIDTRTADAALMVASPARRLPSVLVLLLVAGMLLSIPFALVTRSTLDEMSDRLDAASDVEAGVAMVGDRIELASALAAEATATSAVLVARELPAPVLAMISADFDEALELTRTAVDAALDALDGSPHAAAITAAREGIESGELANNEGVGALLDVDAAVAREMQAELVSLSEAVGRMGGAEHVARNLDVASAAVDLSVHASESTARWGGLVNPADPPTAAEGEQFIGAVSLWYHAQDVLEVALVDGSELAATWASLRDGPSHQTVELVYDDTISSFAEARPVEGSGEPDVVVTPELIAELQVVNEVVGALEEVVVSSYELARDAVAAVDEANEALQSDANSQRTRATVLLVGFIGLVLLAALSLGFLVVRPLRRLSSVATAMSRGELDVRAPESGPSELRSTAAALNEALHALEVAEARATTLADGRSLDEMNADGSRHEPGPLSASIDAAVVRLADVMADRELLRRRLEHEAAHDGLTGLASRVALISALERILGDGRSGDRPCALLYLDLDEFKVVNDEFGHQIGDELLRITAERLRSGLGEFDVGGRLGGDELAVVVREVDDHADALAHAERLRVALSEPLTIDGIAIAPGVSVGVAVSDRADLDADQLIGEADLALYRAKQLGRGRVELCDEWLRRTSMELAEFDRLLDRALADDEFVLVYQPVVDAGSGQLYAVEALIRWRRDGLIVTPDQFLPHAERSGRIAEIDRWVLRTAAAQAGAWADHPRLGNVPISINLSGRSLSGPALAGEVGDAVAGAGIAASRLMVEVTENSVLDDVDSALDHLNQLRAMGVRIALDDFGTGYMSLATLRRFDIDVLKIDRSFVLEMHAHVDRSLLELMIRTGHLLGVDVVAEGVETPAQRELLEELGVDALQGFLLARPMPADELVDSLPTEQHDDALGV